MKSLSATEIQAHKEADQALRLKKEQASQAEKAQKISDVKSLIEKTHSLTGTPAESYLRNERGIKGELSDSLRYLPPNSSFEYGEKTRFVKTGALVSIAKSLEGDTKAIQLTYLTPEGKRCVDDTGKKFIKATYGSPTGAFVELQKGDSKSPIVLAEGVETALSVKETGLKGSYYCSLGTSNIDNLDVKGRDVIIAGDWDGSKETDSWKATEKAKASLEDKGNKVFVVYPVQKEKLSEELTPEKVDFNDLLKIKGVESIVARVSEQVPVEMASELSHREIQSENSHGQTNNLSSNETTTDFVEHDPSTSVPQNQEKLLEKVGAQTPDEALKANIIEYFKHELSLEQNKYYNKESILSQVKEDPLDYLRYWQRDRRGADFDPMKPLSSENGLSQEGLGNSHEKDALRNRDFLSRNIGESLTKDIKELDNLVDIYGRGDRCPEKYAELKTERDAKLLSIADDPTKLEIMKEYAPDISLRAESLKEEQGQMKQIQDRDNSRSM